MTTIKTSNNDNQHVSQLGSFTTSDLKSSRDIFKIIFAYTIVMLRKHGQVMRKRNNFYMGRAFALFLIQVLQ